MESLFSSGPVLPNTFGFVGIQVPAGTGMHGPGVRIPKAAAVCAIVIGFSRLMQTPNGLMFKKGAQSQMHPAGLQAMFTVIGKKVSGAGATPNEHIAGVPAHSPNPIAAS